MARKERAWALKSEGPESSQQRSATWNDLPRRKQKVDDGHERQSRLAEEPRRRRIKSSRASGRLKAHTQADVRKPVAQSAIPHHQIPHTGGFGSNMSEPDAYLDSSSARIQSLSQLNPEYHSVLHLKEASQVHYDAPQKDSDLEIGIIHHTEAFTDRTRQNKQQSSQLFRDALEDKRNGKNELPREMAPEISVHLDANADGYYCCGCGIRRSDEHHRVRKFKSGDLAWRNFCRPCHAKHLVSGRDKSMKAKDNFCFGCGFARSSHFNKQHPIRRGQRPVKNFCAHCMKRIFKTALIPTETLLGSSSDESDSESDGQHNTEEGHGELDSGQVTYVSVSPHQETTVLNSDGIKNTEAPENSPSEFVKERLHKRRSARTGFATPSKEDQCRPEGLAVNGHEDNDEPSPATCIKHRASAVDTGLKQSSNRTSGCDMASETCNPSLVHNYPRVKRSSVAPSTPEVPITARDSSLEAGSSLFTSDPNSPSKRATFNERVEVRTSPTYWQREHSEGDGAYAHFRHEHYHEELREGQKAVPLKDPLKDPDGQSAGQFRLPHCSIDEESFNFWSAPGAGWNAFAAPGLEHNFSSNRSSGNEPHPSTLYTSKGCSTMCDSGLDVGPSDLDEMRPNPSNRQPQLYNDDDFPCDQGKENRPCPTNPIAPERPHSPLSSFGDHCRFGEANRSNWSSRRDGPCASHADPHWCFEGPYSNRYEYTGFSDSLSGEYRSCHDAEFNAAFPSKDQEAIPDDRDFHQGSSYSDFAHQRSFQPRYSRTSERQWTYRDAEPFNIHEGFQESRPRFPRKFPGHSTDQEPDVGRYDPCDTRTPFDSSSTANETLREPKLPSIGCAMEIPDDMSDSDVHNLLIPGYDNYVPWHKTDSV